MCRLTTSSSFLHHHHRPMVNIGLLLLQYCWVPLISVLQYVVCCFSPSTRPSAAIRPCSSVWHKILGIQWITVQSLRTNFKSSKKFPICFARFYVTKTQYRGKREGGGGAHFQSPRLRQMERLTSHKILKEEESQEPRPQSLRTIGIEYLTW